MSKKAKAYFLIVIIILSWGYVGYKIYTAFQGDDEQDLSFDRTEIKKIGGETNEDSIVLLLNYPDPFLKGGNFSKGNDIISSGNSTSYSKSGKPVSVKATQEVPPAAPDINYIGVVKNSEKATYTAMININGKSYFIKPKDVIEGFTILEVSKEYIRVKKGKEILVINK